MNAGRILRAAGYDLEALREELAPIDPDKVNVWPASAIARSFWRAGITGITQWRWVLVHPAVLAGDRERLARLVIHELVHLGQFRRLGLARFMFRYVAEYLGGRLRGVGGREAYLAITAEREARETTERLASTARR